MKVRVVMKKFLYYLLLVAELFAGVMLMSLAWNNTFYIACIVTVVLWVALTAWQCIALMKAESSDKKRKIKRNIALVMLTPTVSALCLFVWLIVGLMSVI